jgi:hypothetical protein
MNRMHRVLPLFLLLTAVRCASTTPVNMNATRRVVGTESAVRIDAEITGDEMRAGVPVPITYEITNQRSEPIAVADIVAESTYDVESNTLTVNVGSEVPGATLLPRLIGIGPGEKKVFSTTARLVNLITAPMANPNRRPSVSLRLKVNFLGDTTGFADLLAMQEKALADAKRADEVFPIWLERNEAVYTNAIPMRWMGRALDATSAARDPTLPASPARRGRRGG